MFCANCGTKNEDGAMFCANCGAKLEVAPAAPVAPVAEAAAPVVEAAAPVVEAAAPVVEAAAPVVEAVAPVVEAAAPVVEAATPVVEPVAPAATPVAEVVPPVTPAAPVQTPAQDAPKAAEKKEKKAGGFKPLYAIIGGVAAVIVIALIVVIAVVAGGSKSGNSKRTAYIYSYYSVEDEETLFTYNNSVIDFKLDSEDVSVVSRSADGSVVLIYDDEEDSLYVVNKNGGKLVSEDVYFADLSYDGSTVAYVDEDEDLYLYTVKNGKITKVSEDVVDSPVLSPSGSAVAYLVDDDDDNVLYVYTGKKEYRLSKNVKPLGLNDKANLIYYTDDYKGALYVTNLKDDSNKIASDVYTYNNFYFNKDLTEIVFYTNNGTFVSSKGGDKIKLSGNTYSFLPLAAYTYTTSYSTYRGSRIYPMATFAGSYFTSDDAVIYVNKKWETNKIINNAAAISVNEAMNIIYYLRSDDTLYYCALDGKFESIKIKDDIVDFKAVNNGKAVYFLDDDDTLYYQSGKGKATKITDDVERIYVSYDDYCFFLSDIDSYEGTLYSVKGTGKKNKVHDDVYAVYTYNGFTEILMNLDTSGWDWSFDVYTAPKGDKFSVMFEEVHF